MKNSPGSADAQALVGGLYLEGRGVPRDPAQAARWLALAADQGDAYAQNNLAAVLLAVGRTDEAVARYQQAAAQDYADALYNLGVLTLEGHGLPRSESAARLWLGRATALGHRGAQALLETLNRSTRRQSAPKAPGSRAPA